MVDVHILLKKKVYTDLICLKDFDSDILVHKLTFYSTLKNLDDTISDGYTVDKIEYTGGLTCTILFMILHLHPVNGRTSHPKHCTLYIWKSMIWFTSLYGVNITKNRNLVSEIIANRFLVLISYVCKYHYCNTESEENGFVNMRICCGELSVSYFVSLSEKENIRMNKMFAGKLFKSQDYQNFYGATYFEWTDHVNINYNGLQGGKCEVDLFPGVYPVCE